MILMGETPKRVITLTESQINEINNSQPKDDGFNFLRNLSDEELFSYMEEKSWKNLPSDIVKRYLNISNVMTKPSKNNGDMKLNDLYDDDEFDESYITNDEQYNESDSKFLATVEDNINHVWEYCDSTIDYLTDYMQNNGWGREVYEVRKTFIIIKRLMELGENEISKCHKKIQ